MCMHQYPRDGNTLDGSFSVVSKPTFASEYSFCYILRSGRLAHFCTAPRSKCSQMLTIFSPTSWQMFREFAKQIFQRSFLPSRSNYDARLQKRGCEVLLQPWNMFDLVIIVVSVVDAFVIQLLNELGSRRALCSFGVSVLGCISITQSSTKKNPSSTSYR